MSMTSAVCALYVESDSRGRGIVKKVLSRGESTFFTYSAGVSAFSIAEPATVVEAESRTVYMT